jgi:hypothetical protein
MDRYLSPRFPVTRHEYTPELLIVIIHFLLRRTHHSLSIPRIMSPTGLTWSLFIHHNTAFVNDTGVDATRAPAMLHAILSMFSQFEYT